MKRGVKIYGLSILLAEGVGALSGLLTRGGMERYESEVIQPSLSPPMVVFPVVWGLLYALMGAASARVWLSPPSEDRKTGLGLYLAQLAMNFFWSLIFFNARAFGAAAIWLVLLWSLVLGMILKFKKTDPVSAWLQIPYLFWLTFALYLNLGVWYLNG